MKVLHLATSLNGGAGTAALRVAQAQSLAGLEVSVLAANGRDVNYHQNIIENETNLFNILNSKALTYLQEKVIQNTDYLLTPLSFNTLKSNFDFSKFDIVHLHASYNFIRLSSLYDRLERIPFVTTMHDQRTFTGGCHYSLGCEKYKKDCKQCPQTTTFFDWVPSKTLARQVKIKKFAKTYISPSNWLANIAKESQLLNNQDIRVIRNPIPDLFSPKEEKSVRGKELIIGFVSENLRNPYKGIDILEKALDGLPTSFKISLRQIGSGHGISTLRSIETKQIYCRSSNDVANEIRKCDLIVVPSLQDNSPSVVSESLMCGVPVIGSEIGGITEILENFDLPTFPAGNYERLSTLIKSFRPLNPIVLSGEARNFFSYKISAAAHRELYSEVLEKVKN